MCNLYSQTKSQDAMRHVFEDVTGNLPAQSGICPDYAAPIIRHGAQAEALQLQRPLPDGMLQIVAEGWRVDAV